MRYAGRGRQWTSSLVAAVVVATLVTAVSAGAADASPVTSPASPTVDTGRKTTEQALREARQTHKRVTVTAATTATDTVTANPNGTLTLDRSLVPTRRNVNGAWHHLDATLHRNSDGTLSPAMTLGDLRVSGGGTGPMATMTADGTSLSITAPTALPAPTVSGNVASYADVLPGVDLVVTAGELGGFSHVLVIHDATAAANPALASLQFTTRTKGLTVAADSHGNLRATDRIGRAVFTAPTPMAWDSSASASATAKASKLSANQIRQAAHGRALLSSVDGAGTTATQVTVPVSAAGGRITLTPPTQLLTGARTVYPVYVDPTWNLASWGASKTGYASVAAALPDSNKWNNSADPDPNLLQVGNADGWKARSMINFPIDLGRLRGATIYTAELDITDVYSYSCTAKTTNLYAPATTLTSSNATWNYWNGVATGSLVASPSFAHGYNSSCPAATAGFDIRTGIAAAISANRSTQTFWLRSPNESDTTNFKEFSAKSATISVTYNRTPTAPSPLTTSPATSCAANPASIVGDGPVSLYAKVSDPDGGTLGVRYNLWKTSTPATILASTDPNAFTAASGTTSTLVVSRTTLTTAAAGAITQFSWKVQTYDGYATGPWSTTCSFRFDPTRTGPPTIALPASSTIGQPATFTITPPATGTLPSGYQYQLNGGAPGTVTADASGNASITVTPTRFTNTLTVTGTSAAGNIGDTASATFNAQPAATAIDGDFTGDGTTDLLTPGGNGMPPGLWLAPGTGAGSDTPYRLNRGGKNLGIYGNGLNTTITGPTDYTGAQVLSGHFTGSGLQDVLVYYPTGTNTGLGAIINGNGDGSPLQPQYSGNETTIYPGTFNDGNSEPLQLANAGNTSGNGYAYPDLIGVAGNSGVGYYLAYYPNFNFIAGYGEVDDLPSVLTPTGGTDWNTWTIATAQLASGKTAMFLWQKTTGQLHLWTDLAYDPSTQTLTYTPYQLSSAWNINQPITLAAADVNNDGIADLRTVGSGGVVTAYLVTNLSGTAATITTQPAQTIMTANHAWILDDASDGTVASVSDAVGTLTMTGTGSPNWNTGDLFSPDVKFNGTNLLSTAANTPAVATNADFTVSAWVKLEANTPGTVLAQDGLNGTGFKVWPNPSDLSWRFAMTRTDALSTTWDTATAPAGTVQLNAWTLITATYRQTGGLMNLYVNGGLVARATHPVAYNATGPFHIGAQKNGTNIFTNYLTGQVSQVQTWNYVANGNVAIFGFLPSKQLTYTEIDSNTGDHVKDLTSTATMPWTPKAMATLNATTVLVTDTLGHLYRIDITATDTTLYFNPPAQVGIGWTHTLLAADGYGKLFGISGTEGTLHRYDVTKPKPTSNADLANNTIIDTGFTLNTLTGTGSGWILGTTASAGTLISYQIIGAGNWVRGTLDPDGWWFTNLTSPGGGLYYARTASGGLYRYKDANPYDNNGADIQYFSSDPVDHTGWNQTVLSAQPNTVG